MKNEKYKKELADLKYKMEKAERFAERLPMFSEKILQDKISGDSHWINFGEKYKDLYCAWGINRGLYEQGTNRTVTNYYGEPYKEYLFNIYINTLSQYDSHEKFGLNEIEENTLLFFYDKCNSTFYATDNQIEGVLNALCAWYEKAKIQIVEHNKQKEIEELKARLNNLTKTQVKSS